MEERFSTASRWLTALAVILIPLSVIAIVSGAWGVNYQFDTNQWTSYLLFASWVLLMLSVIAGISNLISPPEREPAKIAAAALPATASETDEDEGEEEEGRVPAQKEKAAFNFGYALLLAQACTFALGMILYVAYISWMILGVQPYPVGPGF
jgi:hypothetical protein